jgi:Heme exporter protein D (CcmD)
VNHWPFIVAAYAITLLGTAALSIMSWRAARTAEAQADVMNKER